MALSEQQLREDIVCVYGHAGKQESYLSRLDRHPAMKRIDALLEDVRINMDGVTGPGAMNGGKESTLWLDQYDRFVSTSCGLAYPTIFGAAQGPYVWDVNGNRYLDATSGIGVMNAGHKNPSVERYSMMQNLLFRGMAPGDIGYAPYAELCQKLAEIAPGSSPKRVELFNSGTEAVECALKNAVRLTGREQFIAFNGAFHGRTFGSLAMCASKASNLEGFGPRRLPVHHVSFPQTDVELAKTVDEIDALFRTKVSGRDIAAMIVEPVQGEGGYRFPPKNFLRTLRTICDTHGILLIVDEVQTGMGRTGTLFALDHEASGEGGEVEPDALILGKGLGNGFPLSAVVARGDLLKGPEGSHGNTNGGITAIAGLAVLEELDEPTLRQSHAVGAFIRHKLSQCLQRHPGFGNVRGKGAMTAMDIDATGGGRRRNIFIQAAFERGLLTLAAGKHAVRIIPPVKGVSEEVGECIVELLDRTAEDVE